MTEFFADFDDDLTSLHVDNYGMELTTLENIFLAIGHMKDPQTMIIERAEDASNGTEQNGIEDVNRRPKISDNIMIDNSGEMKSDAREEAKSDLINNSQDVADRTDINFFAAGKKTREGDARGTSQGFARDIEMGRSLSIKRKEMINDSKKTYTFSQADYKEINPRTC